MKRPILIVEWYDASSTDPWTDIKDLEGTVRCVSIGFVVKRTKDYISLASTWDGGEQVCTVIHIPHKMIIRKRKVSVK